MYYNQSDYDLDALPDNTEKIKLTIYNYNLNDSYDITRFYNLVKLECANLGLKSIPALPNLIRLYCHDNQLSTIPFLPKLEILYCCNNEIINLPLLPNLKNLFCSHNLLTNIPQFSKLKELLCDYNRLTILPPFPNLLFLECSGNNLTFISHYPKLLVLKCYENQITVISLLPRLLQLSLGCRDNPIYNIIGNNVGLLNIWNKFRHVYYSIKYKNKFMNWLWDKVRRPKIEQMYHPDNLLKLIDGNENWEEEIETW